MATSKPTPSASTMKAVQIDEFGDASKLRFQDAPIPALDPGQLLVKVRYAGVNPIDWKIREGRRKDQQFEFPLTMGYDLSGEVADPAGSNEFPTGTRVFGFSDGGTYAEYAAAAVTDIAAIPEEMDFPVAASLPTSGLTALQAVRDAAALKPGQRVLIHAAAGGVGSFAAQIAITLGAEVLGTATGADLDYLRSLGLAMVIDYKKERFEDRAGHVDAVIDLIGGETLERSYAIVNKGGVIVSTVYQVDEAKAHAAGIRGINLGMKWNAPDLKELAALVESGKVKPRMSRTFPLSQAADAQRLGESGQAHGKLLLQMPSSR